MSRHFVYELFTFFPQQCGKSQTFHFTYFSFNKIAYHLQEQLPIPLLLTQYIPVYLGITEKQMSALENV